MDIATIKGRIKEIIYETTNIEPDDIGDTAHFVKDLELDSLTLLEIGVDIDQEYMLDLPEEEMKNLLDVQSSAELVMAYLEKKAVKG